MSESMVGRSGRFFHQPGSHGAAARIPCRVIRETPVSYIIEIVYGNGSREEKRIARDNFIPDKVQP
jgi:hypothetical protein